MKDWKSSLDKLLKTKLLTDSDIYDFSVKHNVAHEEIEYYLCELAVKGTSCEGCKHICRRYSRTPCSYCNRNNTLEDKYEKA